MGGAGRGGGGQSLSLEDLLHKPVARVQKNCLSLQDLIKYTLATHPDYEALNQARDDTLEEEGDIERDEDEEELEDLSEGV